MLLLLVLSSQRMNSQDDCPRVNSKRAERIYKKAVDEYIHRQYTESIYLLNQVIDIEPEFVDAHFVLGLIYITETRRNLKAAEMHFLRVEEICPTYDIYAYYHLAEIYYGAQEYEAAVTYLNKFLADVDLIKSDKDYNDALKMLSYAEFYVDMMSHPVPFNPRPVAGVSTKYDEYLPIISPDQEIALFTRRFKAPPSKNDLIPKEKFVEKFMYSFREGNNSFGNGLEMPFPFNRFDNEGGATLTIDNKELFYTVCKYANDNYYYNCDICYSEFRNGSWSEIKSLSDNVNREDTWESQPTITSDGNTLFFVSDRDGGYGGYDLYKTTRDESGAWSESENMGPVINSSGNEKSPFIHTDSQTLYFSSDGLMGMGGYDIFYSKLDDDHQWSKPKNIGYPINSFDDDVGFFVSTDGKYGYFASNKYNGVGGWDLYSFFLHEEARPEKVLFVKGHVENEKENRPVRARVELKNVETKKIRYIPVDSVSGEYVAAVPFREDYVMTVKKKGFSYDTKYFSRNDTVYESPVKVNLQIKPISIGESYRLSDVYFPFASFELTEEARRVIDEFAGFLNDNPEVTVSIQGHTDEVGDDNDNLVLSENRAKSVYSYLIESGIDPNRLEYKGFGERRPIASNTSEEGRALNRRTEFVITGK